MRAIWYHQYMQTKKRTSPIPNIFGTFGYLSLAIQWLWVFVIFIPPLMANPTIKNFITPEKTDQSTLPSFAINADSLLMTIIAVVITVIVLGVTMIVLAKLPIAIVRAGQKSVETVTENVVPLVTHRAHISPKKKRALTVRLMIIVKLSLVAAALLLLSIAFFVRIDLAIEIIFTIGAITAIGSLVGFGLQYVTAKWLKVPFSALR